MQTDINRFHNGIARRIDHRDRSRHRDAGPGIDDHREHPVGHIIWAGHFAAPIADVDLRSIGGHDRRVRIDADGHAFDDRSGHRVDHRQLVRHVERDIETAAICAQRETTRCSIRDADGAVGSKRSVALHLEGPDVVAGASSDPDPVAGWTEAHADETVPDADGLLHGATGHIDDVQRSRIEVASGHDGHQGAVRTQHHAQRTIVDLDVLPGWR